MGDTMPALFLGHGSPMNAIEQSEFRREWAQAARGIPRPAAVLCVSAHWETRGVRVTAAERPETIHDFYGFPDDLYRLHYEAPGAPELAERVAKMTGAVCDPSYGLDHGAWVPAMLGWPEADVPIFQLAVQPYMTPAHHLALGRKLAPLREEGILVLGSGSATHNLRRLMRGQHAVPPEPWARAFDDWLAETLAKGDEAALANYRTEAPHARDAHPTDEHFLPLHVAFGAAGKGARGKPLHRSFTSGNLSMAAYAFA